MVNIGSGDNKIRYDPEHWRPSQLNGGSPGYTENKLPNLRISEIHYHPGQVREVEREAGFDDRDQFEFIELKNIGEEAIQMDGFQLSGGVSILLVTINWMQVNTWLLLQTLRPSDLDMDLWTTL